MFRINSSNCIRRIVWFGADEVGILPILIGMKEANAAALQLCSPTGCGGEYFEFKRANELKSTGSIIVLPLIISK